MSGKSVASCWKFKIDMATGSPLHESPIPYQDNQGTFDYICENLNCRGQTGRPSFLAIHGTPGLGKSALLERFSSLVAFWTSHPNQDRPLMLRKASNWLQNAIIISITFNHKSHVKPYVILIIHHSYYCNLTYKSYCSYIEFSSSYIFNCDLGLR